MPRWPAGLHKYAATDPAVRQLARRIPRPAVWEYSQVADGIPLGDAQGQALVAGKAATVQIGPQGIGTVWYPAQVTVSTTTGVLDTSSCDIYVGPGTVLVRTNLMGTIFPAGRGVLAVALPPMPVGWFLTAVWSGATNGDIAAVNVTGSKRALTR